MVAGNAATLPYRCTQGIELLNWVAARGALTGQVHELHRNYHIPISNTAAGLMLFENRD